ncbi:MAG: RND family transporter [Prolixibacteraceae bacterium]|nr:RND family transporter [Prolixibacteraceae bacterium]
MVNILSNKYKYLFIVITIILIIISAKQIPNLKIDVGFDNYIPGEVGNKTYLNEIDSIFGSSEKILIILTKDRDIVNQETFNRIKELTKDLENTEGIEHCMSLKDVIEIRLDEDGITSFDPIFTEIPTNPVKKEKLEQKILNNEMGNRFISKDLTSTAIILTKTDSIGDNVVIPSIQKVIKNHPGSEKVYIGGLPFIRQNIKYYIKKDLIVLLPLALLMMVIMLYFSFREWKGIILPFMVVILSTLFSFGLMGILHWKFSLVSILLPIMLIAIANDYSIHLINLYQEKYRSGNKGNIKQVILEVYRELRKPILLTGLTTIGGILGLLTHKMIPARQLGILTATGIAFALVLSLYLVPVLLCFYKKPEIKIKNEEKRKKSVTNRILNIFSECVTRFPRKVIFVFIILAIVNIIGIFFLKIDTNIEEYFPHNSEIKQGINLVNKKFGGSQYISVLFHGDILSTDCMKRIDQYTKKIKKIPEAGHVISPSNFLKNLSKGMYSKDEEGYMSLPKSKAEAQQNIGLIRMSGYDNMVSRLIDENNENTRILVSVRDGSNSTGKALLKKLRKITKDDPLLYCIAGPGLSKIQISDMVIRGQISSIIAAFAIIFILIVLIFRSFKTGINGCIPLVLSSLFLFGLMGFCHIPLDIVTAMLSSVMIGVGVDYTIHFLWRYKLEYKKYHDSKLAAANTLKTSGRGIIFNAFSVITGFSVLIFSDFIPLRYFGFLIVISIFSCLICALLLVPSIVVLTEQKKDNINETKLNCIKIEKNE